MACFWMGLHQALNKHGRAIARPEDILLLLKEKNIMTPHIAWNGEYLSNKQQDENFIAISTLNVTSVHRGYDCSIADPVLFLTCHIYNVSIEHNYNGHLMMYSHSGSTSTMKFKSDLVHFWFIE